MDAATRSSVFIKPEQRMMRLGWSCIAGGEEFAPDGVGPDGLKRMLESLRPAAIDRLVVVLTYPEAAFQEPDSLARRRETKVILAESDWRIANGLPGIVVGYLQWVNDFAYARNHALKTLLEEPVDWFGWSDHDDVLESADRIRPYLESLAPGIGGVWCPYVYATDEYGNVSMLHDRERLLRTGEGWHWDGPLHEVAVPERSVHWARCEEISWKHNPRGGSHSERNLPILIDWVKREPLNIRVWLYLGNQYFADQNFLEAARWYTKFWMFNQDGLVGTPTDRWIAMKYGAKAWRELGDTKHAIQADMASIAEFPEWADGYVGMAENMLQIGARTKDALFFNRAIHWGEMSLKMKPADRVAFINPLDYNFVPWQVLNVCYASVGRVQHAIEACELALSIRPEDKEMLSNLDSYRRILPKQEQLEAYIKLAPRIEPDFLDMQVKETKPARDIWVPNLITKTYLGTQPRVGIFCGDSYDEWDATTPSTKGIGGSETAVVEVARRLAQQGHQVIVWNKSGRGEGNHEGVVYADWERFRPHYYHDLLVSWRRPVLSQERPSCGQLWLWMHDLNVGEVLNPERAGRFNRIMGVSQWHADYLRKVYPFIRDDQIGFLPNGVDFTRFDQPHTRKQYAKAVYISSPDRGLGTLLNMWSAIRHMEPPAELHIFYGFENFQKAIQQGHGYLQAVQDRLLELGKQPGVFWRGRVDQQTLAKEMLEAELWLYPSMFLETSCISAVEALAADLFIVASHCGNVPHQVGDAGTLIQGVATSEHYQRKFLAAVQRYLNDTLVRVTNSGKGPKRARETLDFTWERAAHVWLEEMKQKVAVSA